jgi:hypothetical protein
LTIFAEKIGVFRKNQCYDQFFSKFSFVLSQNANFFADFFGENIFKIITSVPDEFVKIRPKCSQPIFAQSLHTTFAEEKNCPKLGLILEFSKDLPNVVILISTPENTMTHFF